MSQLVCESCGTAGDFDAPAPGIPATCPTCSGTQGPKGVLFGKYKLMSEIGRGSMGVVHDAQDSTLHRRVALKIMHERRGGEPKEAVTEWQRFIQEARLTANVAKHANIVTVYEAAVHDSRRYIAMEFVAGEPLGRWRAGRSTREQIRVLRDVSLAVHHAHEHGIIHRDLKPGNVLVGKGSVPVVTDFGLATWERRGTAASLTPTGYAVGSPAYMSPEQARGQKDVGRATDIYSLGIMLYEAVAERPPFEGKNPVDTLSKVVEGTKIKPSELAPLPGGDPDLDAIIMKAIALEPSARYATAAELAAKLTGWLDQGTAVTPRKPRLGLIAAATAAALLAVGVMYAIQYRGEQRAAAREKKILAELDETVKKIEAMRVTPPIFAPLEHFKQKVAGQFNETSAAKISYYTAGIFETEIKIPDAGNYELTITASGTEAAGELPRLRVTVDDEAAGDVGLHSVKPEDYHLAVHLTSGEHHLGIEFTNDLYNKETREDRNLFVHHVSLRKR